jgi:hypothetical protein
MRNSLPQALRNGTYCLGWSSPDDRGQAWSHRPRAEALRLVALLLLLLPRLLSW